MTQVRNPFARAGIRNFGGLEFFPHIPGSQSEFEPAIGEQVGVDRVAGK